MTVGEEPKLLQKQIAKTEKRLEDARARLPKHDPPAALIAEIDELDEELERLRSLTKPKSLSEQIVELERRLADARARIPKHTPPPALMVEIDELEEELERLRSRLDDSK